MQIVCRCRWVAGERCVIRLQSHVYIGVKRREVSSGGIVNVDGVCRRLQCEASGVRVRVRVYVSQGVYRRCLYMYVFVTCR